MLKRNDNMVKKTTAGHLCFT